MLSLLIGKCWHTGPTIENIKKKRRFRMACNEMIKE